MMRGLFRRTSVSDMHTHIHVTHRDTYTCTRLSVHTVGCDLNKSANERLWKTLFWRNNRRDALIWLWLLALPRHRKGKRPQSQQRLCKFGKESDHQHVQRPSLANWETRQYWSGPAKEFLRGQLRNKGWSFSKWRTHISGWNSHHKETPKKGGPGKRSSGT